MPRNYYNQKTRKFRNQPQRKNKYFAISKQSNILVKNIILDDNIPAVAIRSFVPKSFLSKKAKRRGIHTLIPSKKCVVLPSHDAHGLVKALQKCLPPKEALQAPEPYFGTDFEYAAGSVITFPDGEQEISEHNVR